MRFCTGILLLACASFGLARASDDAEVARAQQNVEKMRALATTGVVPRIEVQKAEEALADAQDAANIRANIYRPDLTEDQAKEMTAAADRRFQRRQKAFDDAKKMVDSGIMSQASLISLVRELDFARKEFDLASTRTLLAHDMEEMARSEEVLESKLAHAPAEARQIAEHYDGDGIFTPKIFDQVETAFAQHFGKPLPVSAMGETGVHRALGFDHHGRVDVAIHPDQPEGIWLREYLTRHRIPYFAFRQAVAGKATGAHIHMGPMSTHLTPGG